MKNKGSIVASAALALLAAGCGVLGAAEPSQGEMQDALLRSLMGAESKPAGADRIWLRGTSGRQQVAKLTKTACGKPGETPGRVCDFEVETCLAKDGECEMATVASSGRFTKGDDGTWQYIADGNAPRVPRFVEMATAFDFADIMESGGPPN